MEHRKLLKLLKRRVAMFGAVKVASDLGYRSDGAIRNWIAKGRIPEKERFVVEKYLNECKYKEASVETENR